MNERNKFPMVSIIIPVYGTEAYLSECMSSVLEQDYGNMEAILVDDGSPDGCPALCDWYGERYEWIHVFHQKNQGLGVTRNTGLKNARGEFVLFLDSDDLLSQSNVVSVLMEMALKENADIVVGNFQRFRENQYASISRHHLASGNDTKTVDFRLRGFLTEGHLIMDWGKVYRRDFLLRNHLWCQSRIHMEDKLRNMMCCTCEPVYAFVENCVYLYRITEGSITQRYREKTRSLKEDWIYVAEYFYRFLQKEQKLEQFGDLLAFHVFCGIFTIGRQPLEGTGEKRRKSAEILREYGRNPLVHCTLLALARGKYLKGMRSLFWMILLRLGSVLFCMRAYGVIVWGIFLLKGLGTESRGANRKNR